MCRRAGAGCTPPHMQNEVLLSDADLLAKVTTVAVKEQLLT